MLVVDDKGGMSCAEARRLICLHIKYDPDLTREQCETLAARLASLPARTGARFSRRRFSQADGTLEIGGLGPFAAGQSRRRQARPGRIVRRPWRACHRDGIAEKRLCRFPLVLSLPKERRLVPMTLTKTLA